MCLKSRCMTRILYNIWCSNKNTHIHQHQPWLLFSQLRPSTEQYLTKWTMTSQLSWTSCLVVSWLLLLWLSCSIAYYDTDMRNTSISWELTMNTNWNGIDATVKSTRKTRPWFPVLFVTDWKGSWFTRQKEWSCWRSLHSIKYTDYHLTMLPFGLVCILIFDLLDKQMDLSKSDLFKGS